MMRGRWHVCIGTAVLCVAGASVWANGSGTTLPAGPVQMAAPERAAPLTEYLLATPAGSVVAQSDAAGRVWSWGTVAIEGDRPRFVPSPYPQDNPQAGVRVLQLEAGVVEVRIDGQLFTRFHYDKDEPKPFLWPVVGPTGHEVTRAFPMKDVEGERKDHPHHRSIWCAWGEVVSDRIEGATNYWHEAKEPAKQDRQIVRRIVRTASGPVFGLIEAHIDWVARNGQREFAERRTYTFYRGDDDNRVIDVTNVFAFDDTDVTFRDTKEAAILSVRVATSMDEVSLDRKGPGQGTMANSRGGRGSAECWGAAAEWCDYVGPVNGRTVGIAIFDDPANLGHPTRWHIRDYGLYSANPIAVRSFLEPPRNATPEAREAFKKVPDGSKTFKKGESVTFNYRVLIHAGGTDEARVADAYKLYTLDRPAAPH